MKQPLAAFSLLTAFALSCVDPVTGPGDEVMGNFQFQAELLPKPAAGSGLEAFPRCDEAFVFNADPFEFSARFARMRDAGEAFITIGGFNRSAQFDGQVMSGSNDPTQPAQRVFRLNDATCDCAATIRETLKVALLSTSQNAVAGNSCPADALDGGTPLPTPDGGVRLPDTTPTGFDAVRACGELTDDFLMVANAQCACQSCTMRYTVRGVRR